MKVLSLLLANAASFVIFLIAFPLMIAWLLLMLTLMVLSEIGKFVDRWTT